MVKASYCIVTVFDIYVRDGLSENEENLILFSFIFCPHQLPVEENP